MIDHGFETTLHTIAEYNIHMLMNWRNDYKVWKTCRQNDLINERQQHAWYDKIFTDPAIKMYLIKNKTFPEESVGVCGLTSIDLYNRHAEFSLYIAPEFQGKGYSKNALRTLLTHAFNTLNLNLVWGEVFEDNKANEIFKSIGFKHEGVRRDFYFREGKYLDAHLYSIKSGEFFSRSANRIGVEKKSEVNTVYKISLAGGECEIFSKTEADCKRRRKGVVEREELKMPKKKKSK